MIAAARAATVGRMETFWTIMAYAFVLGLGALGGLVTLLWLNAAKLRADARRPLRGARAAGAGPGARAAARRSGRPRPSLSEADPATARRRAAARARRGPPSRIAACSARGSRPA